MFSSLLTVIESSSSSSFVLCCCCSSSSPSSYTNFLPIPSQFCPSLLYYNLYILSCLLPPLLSSPPPPLSSTVFPLPYVFLSSVFLIFALLFISSLSILVEYSSLYYLHFLLLLLTSIHIQLFVISLLPPPPPLSPPSLWRLTSPPPPPLPGLVWVGLYFKSTQLMSLSSSFPSPFFAVSSSYFFLHLFLLIFQYFPLLFILRLPSLAFFFSFILFPCSYFLDLIYHCFCRTYFPSFYFCSIPIFFVIIFHLKSSYIVYSACIFHLHNLTPLR